jgi:cellulose synthase (UDP-forming)
VGARTVSLGHHVARVELRPTFTASARTALVLLVAANASAQGVYLVWLLSPARWTALTPTAGLAEVAGLVTFAAVAAVELVRAVQCVSLWVFSLSARDPVWMRPAPGLRVALLTTIVPAVEPLAAVAPTLAAMRRVAYAEGALDVWVLDEADDPGVREVARDLGVRHFSRHGRPGYNRAEGPFRARTKAGNHNAWLAEHGHGYDVVAQLDPDHVPRPELLERTLGYFRDPDVAFVVAPQVYGDAEADFVAHAAASQAYVFHGVVQRGGNGLAAPLLIGTNHVYRVATWQQVGGYQDSIIEDHLTSMTVHGTTNPATGNRWKGVYTPDIVAVGCAPGTWGDFFAQQRRWAYGATEIALRHSPRLAARLGPGQRLTYALLQSFYPGVALTWVLGTLVTMSYLTGVARPPRVDPAVWSTLWTGSVLTTLLLVLWLRRSNVMARERRELGLRGGLATLMTAPVYTAAVIRALLRRPLGYHVTRKGDAATPDDLRIFTTHLAWLVAIATAFVVGVAAGSDSSDVTKTWATAALVGCGLPVATHLQSLTRRRTGTWSGSRRRGSRARPGRSPRRRTPCAPRPPRPVPPVPAPTAALRVAGRGSPRVR